MNQKACQSEIADSCEIAVSRAFCYAIGVPVGCGILKFFVGSVEGLSLKVGLIVSY